MNSPLYVHFRRDGNAWLVRFEDPERRIRRNWTENWFLPVPRRRAPFRYLLWQIYELARKKGLPENEGQATLVIRGPLAELLRELHWSRGGRKEDREELLRAAEIFAQIAIVSDVEIRVKKEITLLIP